jgi:hypothetical protein
MSFYHGTSQGYAGPALAKAMALRTRANKRERLYIESTAAYEELVKASKFPQRTPRGCSSCESSSGDTQKKSKHGFF